MRNVATTNFVGGAVPEYSFDREKTWHLEKSQEKNKYYLWIKSLTYWRRRNEVYYLF